MWWIHFGPIPHDALIIALGLVFIIFGLACAIKAWEWWHHAGD